MQEYALDDPETMKIKQLMEMGFDEAKVRAALDSAKGDLNQATDILLSSM